MKSHMTALVVVVALLALTYQNCAPMMTSSSLPSEELAEDGGGSYQVQFAGAGRTISCQVYSSVKISTQGDYNVECDYSGPALWQLAQSLTFFEYRAGRGTRDCSFGANDYERYGVSYGSPTMWALSGNDRGGARFLFPPGRHQIEARIEVARKIDPVHYEVCYSNETENTNVDVPQMDVQCPWPNPDLCTNPIGSGGSTTTTTTTAAPSSNFESKLCITYTSTSGKRRSKCAKASAPDIGVTVDRTKSVVLEVSVDQPGQYSCNYRDKLGAQAACELSRSYEIDPSIYPSSYWLQTTVTRDGIAQTRKVSF